MEIARSGPPTGPLNLDEVLRTLGGKGEAFRGIFMAELKRFLDRKGKEFPHDQQLTFTPLGLAGGESRIFTTKLGIVDSSGGYNEYPISIQVDHLSGFHKEDSSQVGTVVVSIHDADRSLVP